jgi:S1-C subfamily serine protease
MGKIFNDFRLYDSALSRLSLAVLKMPGSASAVAEYARAANFSGQHAQALSILRAAQPSAIDSVKYQTVLADVLRDLGRSEEAIRAYARSTEIQPDAYPLAYYNLGLLYAETGRLEQAEAALRSATQRLPSRSDGWGLLGFVETSRGDYTKSVAAFERALRQDPAYFDRFPKLRPIWLRAISIAGDQPPARLPGEVGDSLALTATASGFFVDRAGLIVTNHHVIDGCRHLSVRTVSGELVPAAIKSDDPANDLALLSTGRTVAAAAQLRVDPPPRSGESVIAIGYPLAGILSDEAKVTTGSVSSLAGIANDSRMIQVTAPIQSGNSGGPLLDVFGNVVGVIVSRLNGPRLLAQTGTLPENVNFAIKASVLSTFLSSQGVSTASRASSRRKPPEDIASEAREYTVLLACYSSATREH